MAITGVKSGNERTNYFSHDLQDHEHQTEHLKLPHVTDNQNIKSNITIRKGIMWWQRHRDDGM